MIEQRALSGHNPEKKRFSMSGIITSCVEFLRDESGPTAVEYAVMCALILFASITIVTSFGASVSSTFNKVNTTLSS